MDLLVALAFVVGLVTIALVVLGAVAAEHYSDRQRERAVLDPQIGPVLGELHQALMTCAHCGSYDLRPDPRRPSSTWRQCGDCERFTVVEVT